MSAKYLSKERFSKANVELTFNKEKGSSLRLLQLMELLLTWCTQQLHLLLSRDAHKKSKALAGQKGTSTSRITQTLVIQMWQYLWSVSSSLAPNNVDHLYSEITLPQTSRRGTETASRHLASTSGLGIDGIPVQRVEYFLFSFAHKLKYQKENKSLFPITSWHNFYVFWNNKQGHLHGIWLLLGNNITGMHRVYFWFIELSHFNKAVLTQTHFPVKW